MIGEKIRKPRPWNLESNFLVDKDCGRAILDKAKMAINNIGLKFWTQDE